MKEKVNQPNKKPIQVKSQKNPHMHSKIPDKKSQKEQQRPKKTKKEKQKKPQKQKLRKKIKNQTNSHNCTTG